MNDSKKFDFIDIKKPKKINAFNYQIPGDISSSAFFMVLTTLANNSKLLIKNVNINPSRVGVITILKKMGAQVRLKSKKNYRGEKISDIKTIIDDQLLGVMLSCVSPENYEKNLKEMKELNVPFGFKLNGFMTTKPKNGYTSSFFKNSGGNPNEFLGHRHDFTPENIGEIAKKFKDNGATILGGCCETRPSHIAAMAKLK